jgi:hypothetical protein
MIWSPLNVPGLFSERPVGPVERGHVGGLFTGVARFALCFGRFWTDSSR